jgi:hypothetical protein
MSLNLEETTVTSRGQLWTGAGRINADFVTRLNLVLTGGVRFSRDIPASFAGTFSGASSPLTLTPTCGGMSPMTMLNYAVQGDTLTVGVSPSMVSGLTITPQYQFRRAAN